MYSDLRATLCSTLMLESFQQAATSSSKIHKANPRTFSLLPLRATDHHLSDGFDPRPKTLRQQTQARAAAQRRGGGVKK